MTETRLLELFNEAGCDTTIYRNESFDKYKQDMSGDTTKLIEPSKIDDMDFWEAYDNYHISMVQIEGKLYLEVLLIAGDGIEKIEEDFTDYALFNNNGDKSEVENETSKEMELIELDNPLLLHFFNLYTMYVDEFLSFQDEYDENDYDNFYKFFYNELGFTKDDIPTMWKYWKEKY